MFRHGPTHQPTHRSTGLRLEHLEHRTMLSATVNDTPSLWDPVGEKWYLRNSNSPGNADHVQKIQGTNSQFIPEAGHFNWGTKVDNGTFYNPIKGEFHHFPWLGGSGVVTMGDGHSFGPTNSSWLPIAGDWDANGLAGIGLYNPATSTFYLRNNPINGGPADITFTFGPAGAGWIPLAGDWDGNGTDTVGLYDPANGTFFLRNQHSGGSADHMFPFGPGGAGWIPLEGDFNGNGQHTIGAYNPTTSTFYLRNVHAAGPADIAYNYGPAGAGWIPMMGDWDRPVMPPQLVEGPAIEPTANTTNVTQSDLKPIVEEAIARWSAAGLDASLAAQLATMTVEIVDLPANMIGGHQPGTLMIDVNAAGHGWFIDSTPSDDVEFSNGDAAGRADLLSTIMHEMGHELGLIDLNPQEHASDVMRATLPLGVRFSPNVDSLDAVYAALAMA